MNISSAKALLGIRGRVADRAALEAAVQLCKARIVAARRASDDSLAATLSEAREVFRQRLIGRGRCEVCSATISSSARRCRLHQRSRRAALPGPPKAKPLPREYRAIEKALRQRNSNARVDVAPTGGPLARLGFHTPPVQKVLSRWAGQVRMDMLERYFDAVATAVVHRETSLSMERVAPQLWPLVFELGLAVAQVFNDTRSPRAWLMRETGTMTNGSHSSWLEIVNRIKKEGGPRFTAGHLAKIAGGMKLTTPAPLGKEFRRLRREDRNAPDLS